MCLQKTHLCHQQSARFSNRIVWMVEIANPFTVHRTSKSFIIMTFYTYIRIYSCYDWEMYLRMILTVIVIHFSDTLLETKETFLLNFRSILAHSTMPESGFLNTWNTLKVLACFELSTYVIARKFRPNCVVRLFFVLLTHQGSHREVYQSFQPSYDIFRRWCQELFRP